MSVISDCQSETNKSEEPKAIFKSVKVIPPTTHGYFHGHDCHLPVEKISSYNITIRGIRRWWFNLRTVDANDIRAIVTYRSYKELCAEKYRHYKQYPYTIHPYSKLRFYLEFIFVIVMIAVSIIMAYDNAHNEPSSPPPEYYNDITLFCNVMIMFNIIVNFFTGYIEGYSCKFAVLSMPKIALNYLKTWLIVDLLASIGILGNIFYHNVTLCMILGLIKVIRIPVILVYLYNILTVMRASFYQKTIVEIIFMLIIYLCWSIYVQFAVNYISEGSYNPTNPKQCSWITIGKLWNQTTDVRFLYAFDRAVAMLTANTNMNLLDQKECINNFIVLCWLFSKIVLFHYVLKYILTVFGTEYAQAQYYVMIKQLETYMVQRNFSSRLKSKIMKFYATRFHSKFFAESRIIECMSGQLREDILMHTGRQLVRELDFLKKLPSSLLVQIAAKLRLVIYIAGDVIVKINTIGDCLYFIDRGTVAIYSSSGKEACHLEDGDYFGEIELVRDQSITTASVVAVTNCELFRLDREYFEATIAYYPTVYNSIKEVARMRLERLLVAEEQYKAELRTAVG